MAYGDVKDLNGRTAADKILRNKAFNIAKNPVKIAKKMMNIKVDSLQWFLNFLIKRILVVVLKMKMFPIKKLKNYTNQLLENLIKEKYTHVYRQHFGGTDLADMQLISKFNKGFRFLLCVIYIYSKYAWVTSLKDKKGTMSTNAFQKYLDHETAKQIKYG